MSESVTFFNRVMPKPSPELVEDAGTLPEFRREFLKFMIEGEAELSDGEETPQVFFEESIRELLAMRGPDPLTEEWRPVPEFPHYQINRCGEVINERGWRLKTYINHTKGLAKGHEQSTLCFNGRTYTRSVGALLREAFKEDYR